jgi:Ca-activated chloride channel family protein
MTITMKRHLVVLACTIPLLAQPPPDFRVDVNLVRVPCVVMQANGAPVQGLRRDEFIVEEDGVPQEVKYLWQELDLPLTVVLVADAGCSQFRFWRQQGQITMQFLERVLSGRDRAALVSATNQARLVTDLTDSLEALRAGTARLGDP